MTAALRSIGSSGIYVSPIGLGTVKFGRNQGVKYPSGFELPDDRSASNLIAQAKDLGINLIDTAPAYGSSEMRIGQLLPGNRADWLICTKAGENYEDGQSSFDFSSSAIRNSVERSLTRLNTDYLDLVLIHSDGQDLDILNNSGAISTLQSMQSKGMIRAIGMSTKTVDGGLAALDVCDVVMVTYNPAETDERVVIKEGLDFATRNPKKTDRIL